MNKKEECDNDLHDFVSGIAKKLPELDDALYEARCTGCNITYVQWKEDHKGMNYHAHAKMKRELLTK